MPVMGPNRDHAYEQGDKITDEILALLKEKHHLDCPSPALFLGDKLAVEWMVLAGKLRETIREMVWVDHCASF